jgi:GLPGLI family protein
MKLFFFFCTVFFYVNLQGQQTLLIEYRGVDITNENFVDSVSKIKNNGTTRYYLSTNIRLLINDTMGRIHHFSVENRVLKKRAKKFGKKIIHHAFYQDFKNNIDYREYDHDRNRKILIVDSCREIPTWNFQTQHTKNILGYNCYKALSINSEGDSTLVYFTNDLKIKNGYFLFKNIPGVVLEAYKQNAGGCYHYQAQKVEYIDLILESPQPRAIVGCNEFDFMKKSGKMFIKGNYFKKKSN